MPTVSPAEVQAVKDALLQDAKNLGVGVLHLPSDRIVVVPFDDLNGGGHAGLVIRENFHPSACLGFVISRTNAGFNIINASHLNGPQGQPGSLQMPPTTFASIEQALRNAGL